ncbi:MAG: serine O-acetyltransferase [Clostridiales bacterium]|nr:serine O-acetyltransferase [Clostridiales bacterium]
MLFKNIAEDVHAVLERDPAARSHIEVFLLYPGIQAVIQHRIAHFFYKHHMKFLARMISQIARFWTGIEIHPGAQIGHGLFIDHGMGVVIGETAVIGDNCTIYQGVTLGGTGKERGKRHPTLGNNVMVGSGAKVLGPFNVGDNSKIAAGAVVLSEVPPNSTCVGVPARIVKCGGVRVEPDLDQVAIPDPVSSQICTLTVHIKKLEDKIKELEAELEGK